MRAGLLLLLLSGCIHRIPAADCQTPLAGLYIRGSADCAGAAAAEARAFAAYEKYVDGYRAELIAKRLHGWTVSIGEPLSSAHSQLQETVCDLRCIFLPRDDWTRGAFAHEVGHVMENCAEVDPKYLDHKDPRDNQKHPNWGSRRIWKAIDSVAGP